MVLHCDASNASPESIPDVNASESSDFRAALLAELESMPQRQTRRPALQVAMGPANVISAFQSLCTSDLVLMARSSLSWMAAALCPLPVFLGAPYHHSIHNFPNAIKLGPIHVDEEDGYYRLHYHQRRTQAGTNRSFEFKKGVLLHTRYSLDEQRMCTLLSERRRDLVSSCIS